MHVFYREDSSFKTFLRRTVAAQVHLFAALLAMVALSYLLHRVTLHRPEEYWAAFVFGAAAILVFSVSSFYHFLYDGFTISKDLEEVLDRADHCAIFCLIAGTYTPVVLHAIHTPWQRPMLVATWLIAAFGVTYTNLRPYLPRWTRHRSVYVLPFILSGWMITVRMDQVFTNLSWLQLGYLFGGGMAYSVGAIIYATEKPRLLEGFFGYHELWHTLVTIGYLCHYLLILSFY